MSNHFYNHRLLAGLGPGHGLARTVALAVCLLCLVNPGLAQTSGATSTAKAGDAGDSSGVIRQEEEAAYQKFFEIRTGDPGPIIAAGESFSNKYPGSRYIGPVYDALAVAYLQIGQPARMMDAANKALTLNPNDVDVLPIMAWVIARQTTLQEADGAQQLQKAAGYARHTMELINAMIKPAALDDASFTRAKNDKLSLCHSSLGVIAAKMGRYPEAIPELTAAAQLSITPDLVDYFVLGFASPQASQFTAALDAYGKCAVAGSPMRSQCQAGIESVKNKAKTDKAGL